MAAAPYEDPSKIFAGVHFVLLGFDSVSQQKVRSKIVDGGGVDVGRYGADCTHVIVDRIVYDDPICLAARKDGKALVTSLWVDHSVDVGTAVGHSSIMYRPLRDLNAIPGAKSLVICLTGYVRQDRDDIMTMVSLMGATFSKPLVANKVTHLICYKFEGEKYELAKKIKRIKLVNHQWLEDCLKNWRILPEADYEKSGYELEMMEAQAKDSEDEAPNTITKQQPKAETSFSDSLLTNEKGAKPNEVPPQKRTPSRNGASASESPRAENICRGLLNSMNKTPPPAMVGSDLGSVSVGYKKSPQFSASNNIALSYSRKTPRKATLPLEPIGNHIVNDCFAPSFSRTEEKETVPSELKSPLEENLLHPEDGQSGSFSGKRKAAISCSRSKLQRTDHTADFISEGALDMDTTEQSAPEPRTNELQGLTSHSPQNNSYNAAGNGHVSPQMDSPSKFLNSVTPEINCRGKTVAMSSGRKKRTEQDNCTEVADVLTKRPENVLNESTKPHDGEVQPPETNVSGNAESNTTDGLYFPPGEASSGSKPLRRKQPAKKTMGKQLAKRTLGSRPSFGRKKAGYQKESINMNEKVPLANSPTASDMAKETEDIERAISSGRISVISPTSNADMDKAINKSGIEDEETEPPQNQEDSELDILSKGMFGDVDVPHSVDTKTVGIMSVENEQMSDKIEVRNDDLLISGEDNVITEAESPPKKMEPGKSTVTDSTREGKIACSRKRSSPETKNKDSSEGAKLESFTKGEPKKRVKNELATAKGRKKKAKGSHPVEGDTTKNLMEMDKENWPVGTGNLNVKQQTGKLTPNRKSQGKDVANPCEDSVSGIPKVKTDPVWFILSGHKLQRKEFKQVITRLKGRVCRDSHQWNYQATHFIVPDPLRRTEKFFAAAASGSWILKTDYLAASNGAGRLLAEEPYEWYNKGLSEDGAINLEAPRKWRLLKERTGHGAFYGMRVVIYGECIAPPLDTLKRVVKAGDGTILATSPPYTRFLKSGVDFAIVSPGMPRVDIWIQEFIRHQIPCVLADALVEYVCKPGYPLDKHVQYSTHSWAEKSFGNLANRTAETVEVSTPRRNDADDLRCHLCGSGDNGEEMLICGDESGSSGCGIGAHMGCCNPPLEVIPKGDWYCEKCSSSNINSNSNSNSKNTGKKSKKSISRSKRT